MIRKKDSEGGQNKNQIAEIDSIVQLVIIKPDKR